MCHLRRPLLGLLETLHTLHALHALRRTLDTSRDRGRTSMVGACLSGIAHLAILLLHLRSHSTLLALVCLLLLLLLLTWPCPRSDHTLGSRLLPRVDTRK
jgi:hypothetical protein